MLYLPTYRRNSTTFILWMPKSKYTLDRYIQMDTSHHKDQIPLNKSTIILGYLLQDNNQIAICAKSNIDPNIFQIQKPWKAVNGPVLNCYRGHRQKLHCSQNIIHRIALWNEIVRTRSTDRNLIKYLGRAPKFIKSCGPQGRLKQRGKSSSLRLVQVPALRINR